MFELNVDEHERAWSQNTILFTSVADTGSKKSVKIMENFHKNQPKSLEYHTFFFKTIKLMFADINIYPINN